MKEVSKPRLLFFQFRYDDRLPSFLLGHKREHAECLAQFFEVTVETEGGDYDEICCRHQPDLVLFESAVPFATCRRPEFTNIRAHAHIPKLGLMHSDSFGEARGGFLADMDRWGIETFFAITTTAPEYNLSIADRLFVWPNFIKPSIFRDYGQPKNIPVLFTGSTSALYPWRRRIIRLVSERYPSLICPHPGYSPQKGLLQILTGERYARLLNGSTFVPACGTAANEVVRKHFEIPASRACLVTEDTPGLRSAGFADMCNCVFADESDVLDKLAYLFDHPAELEAITNAGHRLVHERHTIAQRDQIRQWYELQRQLRPAEKIVQRDPFAPLEVASLSAPTIIHRGNGSHLALLNEGDRALAGHRYDEAASHYTRALAYYRFMAEPQIRLAICHLAQGRARAALRLLEKPIRYLLTEYRSPEPDPVEWAWLIVALFCMGRRTEAARRAGEFIELRHPELDRARKLSERLTGCAISAPVSGRARRSVHTLPERDDDEWLKEVRLMLRACGQSDAPELSRPKPSRRPNERAAIRKLKRQLLFTNTKLKAKQRVGRLLRRLEKKLGYFLPYSLSAMRSDAFYAALQTLVGEQAREHVLVIGARQRSPAQEALRAGLRESGTTAQLTYVAAPGEAGVRVSNARFDVVLVDDARIECEEIFANARFVALEDLTGKNRAAYHLLAGDNHYRQVLADPSIRGGYAIFEKTETAAETWEQAVMEAAE